VFKKAMEREGTAIAAAAAAEPGRAVPLERRASFWLVGLTVVWGSSFFSMKLGMAGMEPHVGLAAAPTAYLLFRFALAAALYPLVFPKVLRRLDRRTILDGLLLAAPFYVGFILQASGLPRTTATVSAFLTNLTVISTPLVGRLFFREALRGQVLLGAALALVGVAVLTNPTGGGLGWGEVLTAASALAFAFQVQGTNRVTRRSDPEAVTFVMFLSAVVLSAATLLVLGVPPAAFVRSLRGTDVAWTGVLNAVLCSVVAITVMNRWQREITPTRAVVIYSLEPVFAAILAAAFGGESLTWRVWAGGAIVLLGNWVCEARR
jgi:drug/metabolite transporter (DMT)-like permease